MKSPRGKVTTLIWMCITPPEPTWPDDELKTLSTLSPIDTNIAQLQMSPFYMRHLGSGKTLSFGVVFFSSSFIPTPHLDTFFFNTGYLSMHPIVYSFIHTLFC